MGRKLWRDIGGWRNYNCVVLLACFAVHALQWWYWIVLLLVLTWYVWWSSQWSRRTKVIRRIVFYILVLVYLIVHLATRKHEPLLYVIFAAAGVYAVAQLVEDVTMLRKKEG